MRYDVSGADLFELDLDNRQWVAKDPSNDTKPAPRYEHTTLEWNGGLIVFGGKLVENERIVDEMWRYDISQSTWSRVDYTSDFGYIPSSSGSNWNLKLAGHTSNLVTFANGTEMMIVMLGYHPNMGFNPLVYEYNPSTLEWLLPRTNGAILRGLFAHTTVYDPVLRMLYIHGGMQSGTLNNINTRLTDQTIMYNPIERKFSMLAGSGIPRYLHSAVFLNGVMFVYGGNAQNESEANRCYSTDMLAYSSALDRYVRILTL